MKWFEDIDTRPLLLVPVLALLAWPLIGSGSTWLTLTVAGMAMGMIIFIMASGLTLVFGLMDVLNFGHGLSSHLALLWPPACWAAWPTGRARPRGP